jgi:hypothetical protein
MRSSQDDTARDTARNTARIATAASIAAYVRRAVAVVRRDIRIASAVALALLGLLTIIDKYNDSAVSDLTLDILRWVASLGGLLSP